MGISGLLPLLASVMKPAHISSYRGQRVAVDAYGWLHRGVFSCGEELLRGQPTDKFVQYFMDRVRLLLHFGVQPVLVFDGGPLPQKLKTEKQRHESRKLARAQAQVFLREGNLRAAERHFSKALEVTPEMAQLVIEELRKQGLEFVVAPYEADAQLAWLCRKRKVAAVISEDSDLIAFGCRRVLFKMDRGGNAQEFAWENLGSCSELDFTGWNTDMMQLMCILSGCDYLDSLNGLGLKRAHSLVRRMRTVDRVLRELRISSKQAIPEAYLTQFHRARLTFKHQRVFDSDAMTLTHIQAMPEEVRRGLADDSFLGHFMDDATARAIAEGRLNPDSVVYGAEEASAADVKPPVAAADLLRHGSAADPIYLDSDPDDDDDDPNAGPQAAADVIPMQRVPDWPFAVCAGAVSSDADALVEDSASEPPAFLSDSQSAQASTSEEWQASFVAPPEEPDEGQILLSPLSRRRRSSAQLLRTPDPPDDPGGRRHNSKSSRKLSARKRPRLSLITVGELGSAAEADDPHHQLLSEERLSSRPSSAGLASRGGQPVSFEDYQRNFSDLERQFVAASASPWRPLAALDEEPSYPGVGNVARPLLPELLQSPHDSSLASASPILVEDRDIRGPFRRSPGEDLLRGGSPADRIVIGCSPVDSRAEGRLSEEPPPVDYSASPVWHDDRFGLSLQTPVRNRTPVEFSIPESPPGLMLPDPPPTLLPESPRSMLPEARRQRRRMVQSRLVVPIGLS